MTQPNDLKVTQSDISQADIKTLINFTNLVVSKAKFTEMTTKEALTLSETLVKIKDIIDKLNQTKES